MENSKPISEQLKDIQERLNPNNAKKLRVPTKLKVNKGRMKKGWIGVFRIGENMCITPTKTRFEGSVYDFIKQGGYYHSSNGNEIYFLEGKYPVIFQQDTKINPVIFSLDNKKNETYGQLTILAKMLKDTIKEKKKGGMGGIAIVVVIVIIGYILGKYVFKLF